MDASDWLTGTDDRNDRLIGQHLQTPSQIRETITHGFPCEPARAPAPAFQELAARQVASEIEAIRQALAATRANASRAARRLHISPQLLHYKMKKH